MTSNPAVVMDNGTGYTKIGYAGNLEPSFVFPTTVAQPTKPSMKGALDDLDFYIGQEALDMVAYAPQKYHASSPFKQGIVENWDQMEQLWQQSIYKYLRCEPEEHSFILTESPYNPPENREYTAEIMFETFGVAALNISVQAVLAIAATWDTESAEKAGLPSRCMTGTVIDSGDGSTQVIPVCDGYVIQSGIKHIPLGGRDITRYIFDTLKDREKTHPEVNMVAEAQRIKEKYCYMCKDLAAEFAAFDANPSDMLKTWSGTVPKTKEAWQVDVGPERFLGPELLFHPQIFSSDFTTTLPELVDEMICGCPIDTRKGLYKNIVLSGGSTMFKGFDKRLKRDIKRRVDLRMKLQHEKRVNKSEGAKEIPINVVIPPSQRFAAWFGGSRLGSSEFLPNIVKSRQEYEEHGSAIFRNSAIGGGVV